MTGRRLCDFGKGDTVCTRTGRFCSVKGFEDGAVLVQFLDDGEEATLLPYLLSLVTRAPKRAFSATFFAGGGEKAVPK